MEQFDWPKIVLKFAGLLIFVYKIKPRCMTDVVFFFFFDELKKRGGGERMKGVDFEV